MRKTRNRNRIMIRYDTLLANVLQVSLEGRMYRGRSRADYIHVTTSGGARLLIVRRVEEIDT